MIEIETPNIKFVLINLYGPNSDNPEFYRSIAENLEHFSSDNYIWCADWNLVISPGSDSFNYKHINNPKARDVVLELCEELNLVDVWRVFHESEKKFTWFRRNPYPLMSRLDFFLVSDDLLNFINASEIIPGYRTDHSAVTLKLQFSAHSRGRGYWKFNNSLLHDKECVKLIKENIEVVKQQYAASPYDRNFVSSCPPSDLQLQIDEDLFLKCYSYIYVGSLFHIVHIRKRNKKKKKTV